MSVSSPSFVIELPNRRATRQLARRLAAALRPGDLVILSGPLGAGKTFLVRATCRALGLPASVPVPSPTFTLLHEYDTRVPLVHADLYRLRSAGEVRELGLDALRDEGRALLVEWGEPYGAVLGGDALTVTLSVDPRQAEFSAGGERAASLLGRMS